MQFTPSDATANFHWILFQPARLYTCPNGCLSSPKRIVKGMGVDGLGGRRKILGFLGWHTQRVPVLVPKLDENDDFRIFWVNGGKSYL